MEIQSGHEYIVKHFCEINIIMSRTVFNLQNGHEYMLEMAMFKAQQLQK